MEIRVCEICGKTIAAPGRKVTCSPECGRELHRRRAKERSQLLREQARTAAERLPNVSLAVFMRQYDAYNAAHPGAYLSYAAYVNLSEAKK